MAKRKGAWLRKGGSEWVIWGQGFDTGAGLKERGRGLPASGPELPGNGRIRAARKPRPRPPGAKSRPPPWPRPPRSSGHAPSLQATPPPPCLSPSSLLHCKAPPTQPRSPAPSSLSPTPYWAPWGAMGWDMGCYGAPRGVCKAQRALMGCSGAFMGH